VKVRFVALLVLVALAVPVAAADARLDSEASDVVVRQIETFRQQTNELRREAGLRPLRTRFLHRVANDPSYRLWVRAVWKNRLGDIRRKVAIPPVWRRLAMCETGGNWRHRNSLYQGGLGFYYASWDAYRPRHFPAEAYLASPVEQVVVGKRIRADVGWVAWPACSIRLGLR
jgi:hypothetical protein